MSYIQEILDRTIGVEVRSAHGPVNVGPRETHALHVRDGGIPFATHSEG